MNAERLYCVLVGMMLGNLSDNSAEVSFTAAVMVSGEYFSPIAAKKKWVIVQALVDPKEMYYSAVFMVARRVSKKKC